MDIMIREGIENMDMDRVTELLSRAHWCRGIGKWEVERGAQNAALVVGAFADGQQVGFCRVISDCTRFAYLSDVYVDEQWRGHGIAKRMVDHVLGHESMALVYQWMLRTTDAQALYRKLGFQAVAEPHKIMEIRRPRPDR